MSILHKQKAQEEFINGIQSLDKAVQILCDTEINTSTSALTVKETVRSLKSPISLAHAHFITSLTLWEGENERQNEKMEELVSSISSVKSSISEKKIEVERLQQQLHCLKEQINDSKRRVQQAKRSLCTAQNTLKEAERKLQEERDEQERVLLTGAIITSIPILGWIAGPTMIAVGCTVLEDNVKAARRGASSAENNVNACERQLQANRTRMSNIRQELSRKEKDKQITEQRLQDLERKLQDLERKLQKLRVDQRRSSERSCKIKRTCHVMTNIWGKSQVLKNEARNAYSLEPLLTPLKEIFDMFTPEEQRKIKENTLLLSRHIDFSSISFKMKAICKANNSLAILDEHV